MENVRVVLVGVQESGNVGMAARAMKNFGLKSLWLVAPEADPLAEEARKFAVGARDVLEAARVVPDLDAALADVHWVAATTARARYGYPGRLFTPRELAPLLRGRAEAGERVALVFGRERSGLTNAELDRAHYVVRIPTDPGFKSLNLAQAVLILAYELFLAEPRVTEQPRPAEVGELEGFFADLE
ncbi:MAG TPA: RNA methyltransferase, partial [Oceanithermus sp.]|nr:RNA methyltransferase [Oceanithermus sp.]